MSWTLSDHVCKKCFGRVLLSGDKARCADCGIEGEGGHESICACGAKMADGGDAGLRCIRNPQYSTVMPREIAVVHKSALGVGYV